MRVIFLDSRFRRVMYCSAESSRRVREHPSRPTKVWPYVVRIRNAWKRKTLGGAQLSKKIARQTITKTVSEPITASEDESYFVELSQASIENARNWRIENVEGLILSTFSLYTTLFRVSEFLV